MNVIGPLIQFQQQLRVFHWQTDSYAQHKAFGSVYGALDDLIDSFVEGYMGVNGRSKPTITFHIELKSLTSQAVVDEVVESFESYLESMSRENITTDLLNTRDEILGEVHRLRYLLSLK